MSQIPPTARYAMARITSLSFAEADRRIRERLQDEGFGVLTEIDVRATVHKKLGVEIAPYVILGACNPALALQAISAEPDVGLLLPCNVVVRELPEGGTMIEALDPSVQLEIAANDRLRALSLQVRDRLERAVTRAAAG
jgi:uncharacterized protein (DUF302 family)